MSEKILKILKNVSEKKLSIQEALTKLQDKSEKDLGFAKVDLERKKRTGYPEVIYGQGKTIKQIVGIMKTLKKKEQNILATRISRKQAVYIKKIFPQAQYFASARCLTYILRKLPLTNSYIAVVTAGTTDIPIAEEAAVTAETYGNRIKRIYDVGVAGIKRLFSRLYEIRQAQVVIVIAGMEGSLASVVGGLIDRPLIAVPTSIGYGANFKGISALLTMLNSCASGTTVVNIDNGFGAGYSASMINHLGESHD